MKITVTLNEQQAALVRALVDLGLYGRDASDVVMRVLDRFLVERVEAFEGESPDNDGEPAPLPEPEREAAISRALQHAPRRETVAAFTRRS